MLDNFFIIFIFRRYPINECQQSLIFYKFFLQPFVIFHFYEKLFFFITIKFNRKIFIQTILHIHSPFLSKNDYLNKYP